MRPAARISSRPRTQSIVTAGAIAALCVLASCPGPTGRTTGARVATGELTVRLVRFDGRAGVFRIHNATRQTVRRVAVGLRGVGCAGPRKTRTTIRVFDLRLRAGRHQSFAFRFEHRCDKAHVAIATDGEKN